MEVDDGEVGMGLGTGGALGNTGDGESLTRMVYG